MSGYSAKPASLSLSRAHPYTLDRDPNLPPPGRTTHLPISSQGSPGPSSSSSQTKERNTTPRSSAEHIVSDYLSFSPRDRDQGEQEEEEEDPEFFGMEVIGASQWEREIPTFKKRKSSPRDILVEESESLDHLADEVEQWAEQEQRFATRSPIAGPSSQPMRTPAFSTTHTSSDLPSGAYPETPLTPHHHQHQHHHRNKESTPISWSPSPLSSRSRSMRKGNGSQFKTLVSDDSESDAEDMENDENVPPSRFVVDDLSSTGKRMGKRRIIDSDDEEIMIQQQSAQKEKGKRKSLKRPPSLDQEDLDVQDDIADIEFPFDDNPTPKKARPSSGRQSSDRVDRTSQAVYDVAEEEAQEDPLDTQYSDFDDFPFDQIDLDAPISTSRPSAALKTSSTGVRTTTRRFSQTTPTTQTNKATHQSNENDIFSSRHADRSNTTFSAARGGDDAMLNRVAVGEAIDEFYIPLIPDLPERWQEFYLNHWRRGANGKSKSTNKNNTASGTSKKQGMTNNGVELISESEEDDAYADEEEGGYGEASAQKRKGASAAKGGNTGPAAKRGKWGWRGAWRGRGRGRGAARKR
ncbi:hypothetical protein IAU59_004945 [Kwoniella sp. CBS 9459]